MECAEHISFEGKEYPITLIYSAKRRTVGITVKRDGTVLLRIPFGYPPEDALSFARSKAAWIAKHIEKFRAREVPHIRYADGDEIPTILSTWAHTSIRPRDIVALQSTAPDELAVDFRFYVRRSR